MAIDPYELGEGTREADWNVALAHLPKFSPPAELGRLVVLAPHPDDEVLACGGMVQAWSDRITSLHFWMLTDGEAALDPAEDENRRRLAATRRLEALEGQHQLGLEHAERRWFGFPDGRLGEYERELARELGMFVDAHTTVLAPLDNDGHRDHDAAGRAAIEATRGRGARLLQYPVWLWHWTTPGNPDVPWSRARRIELSPEQVARKASAVAAHRSQLEPHEDREPVVPPRVLEHFARTFEVVFVPS
jgi:LmbE family N-acetylglucosaminyl deacetylase